MIPIIWDKYVHIRRDLELFLLNKKNEKDRATFEEIIQLMPDSVVIVGKKPQFVTQPCMSPFKDFDQGPENDEE